MTLQSSGSSVAKQSFDLTEPLIFNKVTLYDGDLHGSEMSRQGKPTRITALNLSVYKISHGKNEWWKNNWNHFPV
jgi:hypothetical protein